MPASKKLIFKILIGALVAAILLFLLYFLVIPLLFCTNIDFDLTKKLEYVSCSKDADCIPKECGCLNAKGVKKFSFLVNFCGVQLRCLSPSSCSCQDNKCLSGISQSQGVTITTNKTEYERGEDVKAEINFEGTIYVYNMTGWSIQGLGDVSWENIFQQRTHYIPG